MRRLMLAALGVAAAALPTPLFAHGGGLNGEGCHNDRRNGGYHCHRGSGSSSPARPARLASSGAFANCSAARAAGAAPVLAGSPGYSRRLDRDGDGIGCE